MNQEEYLAEFKKLTDKMYKITEGKNKDYSGVGAKNAFKNFEAVEVFGVDTADGFITRLTDKLMRISNLTRQEANVEDEKITDTLLDAANYCLLFRIRLTTQGK